MLSFCVSFSSSLNDYNTKKAQYRSWLMLSFFVFFFGNDYNIIKGSINSRSRLMLSFVCVCVWGGAGGGGDLLFFNDYNTQKRLNKLGRQ